MSRPLSRVRSESDAAQDAVNDEERAAQTSSYRIERLGPASRSDLMITSRAKRSTAGNKLKALLDQELEKDDIFAEVENDIDFHADENEGIDIVDSDFDRDSDDNAGPGGGGAEDDESEGERELEAREKADKQKKRAQARNVGIVKRPLPPPASRTLNRQTDVDSKDAKRRRISFAPDHKDPHTSSSAAPSGSRRSSARSSTVQSKMQVESRLSEAEQRRAALPVKTAQKKKVTLTQDALIAEALEVEEENRESLRKFLELEEARRAKMRQRKDKMVGPFVRWVSVGLKTRVVEEVADEPVKAEETMQRESSVQAHDNNATEARPQDKNFRDQAIDIPSNRITAKPDTIATSVADKLQSQEIESPTLPINTKEGEPVVLISNEAKNAPDAVPETATGPSSSQTLPQAPSMSQVTTSPTKTVSSLTLDPVLEARREAASLRNAKASTPSSPAKSSNPSRVAKFETQARTLLSVEAMPDDWEWLDEFNALLGTHCDWQSYPFVPARNRTPRPRQSICPITGLPAIYKCPRTGIPFANAEAYAVITKLLENRYIWTGGHRQKFVDPIVSKKGKQKERTGGVGSFGGTIGTGAAPPEMGIYVDSELEAGPAKVWTTARERRPPVAAPRAAAVAAARGTSKSTARTPNTPSASKKKSARPSAAGSGSHESPVAAAPTPPPVKKPRFEVVLTNALAPGDEASVMAAALNLPAGSTRSGRRVHRPA